MSEIDVTPRRGDYMLPTVDYVPPPLDHVPPTVELMPPAHNLGRDKLAEWSPAEWSLIDERVRRELEQACIVTKFLPVVTSFSPNEANVNANQIETRNGDLSIDKDKFLALVEESKSFILSKEQYYREGKERTAATLATHAANSLAQAVDSKVLGRLLESVADRDDQRVKVAPLEGQPDKYGENAFTAVGAAYALLQGNGKYGRYAAVFSANQWSDIGTALATTLINPADRILPVMSAGIYATGQLADKRGLVIAVDGENVDVAIAVHGATAFVDMVGNEIRRFRVYTRFTGRVKDEQAIVLLEFE